MKGIDTFSSPNNYIVWVGKNSRANDVLTFQVAKLDDIWLHATDVQGAHVVISGVTLDEIPKGDLLFAAKLAAINSKSTDRVVKVSVCCIADVSKGKYAPAGQVMIHNEVVLEVSK